MMNRLRAELKFLLAQWQANFASAMEYRAAFISQIVGMFINNAVYFAFWIVFFDRFKEIRGWGVTDMFLLMSIVALGYGLAFTFFGNALQLSRVIAQGQLDYYLALPRNVLLNVLASRMTNSALGDISYGLVTYLFTGRFTLAEIGLWLIASLLAAVIFVMAFTFFHSLSFWLGNASVLAEQAANAMLTFAMYPSDIFQGAVRFIMYSIVPAAFVGVLPLNVVRSLDLNGLLLLALAAVVITILSSTMFYLGLRRYESGSAINVNV
jgi:ABC-2 type transport system permease protein